MIKLHSRKSRKIKGLSILPSLVRLSGVSSDGMSFEMFEQSKLEPSSGRVCLRGLKRVSALMSPSMMVEVDG